MTFLKAFSLIRQALQDPFRLYVCGEGSLGGKVQELASQKGSGIETVGRVDDPMSWIGRGRFIFASGYLSMLEAMICRRLVFAVYDHPLKQDYWMMMPDARDRMVIAGTPNDLAERFCRLLKEPDTERTMIERSCAFAREQSWERMADLYLSLYRSTGTP
jgi:glycosyltransferase involved in cell wall biosynthesis